MVVACVSGGMEAEYAGWGWWRVSTVIESAGVVKVEEVVLCASGMWQ